MAGGRFTLIFCRSRHPLAGLIRLVDAGEWAHCGLVMGDRVIEARAWHGVVVTPLTAVRRRSSAWELVQIDVPDPGPGLARINRAIGAPYDWLGALAVWLRRRRWDDPRREFCSELLAAGLRDAGRDLVHPSIAAIGPNRLRHLVHAAGGVSTWRRG